MRRLILMFVLMILAMGCGRQQSVRKPAPDEKVTVVYEVAGTMEKASIAALINRKIEYFRDVPLPWKYEYEETQGFSVILSAKGDSTESGEITATIYSNGVKVDEKTGTGIGIVAEAKGKI